MPREKKAKIMLVCLWIFGIVGLSIQFELIFKICVLVLLGLNFWQSAEIANFLSRAAILSENPRDNGSTQKREREEK